MNIIIPIGGKGDRFKQDGYILPKPLIRSLGKPIIIRCIESLKIDKNDTIYIPYRKELDNYNFQDIIRNVFDHKFEFIPLDVDTRGAAETVLLTLENTQTINKDDITIVVDSDNIYEDDIIGKMKIVDDNVIFYFKDYNDKPIFSYVNISSDGCVSEIREKFKISENACIGAYGFKNPSILKDYIIKVIRCDNKSNNEFYMSSIYNQMIYDKINIKTILCEKYTCLGTPDQLRIFSSNLDDTTKLRFCFDLDNTLVTYPVIKGDYSTVLPIKKNIEYLRFLKSQGHVIIINTARRMKTHSGNVGKIIADVGDITLKKLREFDIPYDEIYFGKPFANYYIDDLAIKSYDDLEKEMGFYNIHPETRFHNKIEIVNDRVIKYSNSLEGEKYWYQNIPMTVEKYFPKLYTYSNNSITIERINGIPLSYLNTNKLLTERILKILLNSLSEIHSSKKVSESVDVYANYMEKFSKRIDDLSFSDYHNGIITKITTFLRDYELKKKAKIGVIHGDPVFTNILIDNFDNFKFIDMRGKVGKDLTIFGDIKYDYAKIYQSLVGYDYIVMNKIPDMDYLNENKTIFENYIIDKFGLDFMSDVKWITKSLILSLLSLHKKENTPSFLRLLELF